VISIGVTRYLRRAFPAVARAREDETPAFELNEPADAFDPAKLPRNFRDNCAISIAANPASNPLFPLFSPARSIACSSVSHVSTQNIIGSPLSICANCSPRAVSEQT
jgi:hypothetical protein